MKQGINGKQALFDRAVFRKRLNATDPDRILDREAAGADPAKRGHTAAAAERRADIMAEGADIGAFGAADVQKDVVPFPAEEPELMDHDPSRLALQLAALAGDLIELFPMHLDRGIHGRDLPLLARKAAEHPLKRLVAHIDGTSFDHVAGRILRIGRQSQAERCEIALFIALGKGDRPCRASDKDDQKPGRHRVERPGMADAALVEDPLELDDDVVACPVLLLVDQQDAVHFQTSSMTFRSISRAFSGSP